jgi:hypothetical protein
MAGRDKWVRVLEQRAALIRWQMLDVARMQR